MTFAQKVSRPVMKEVFFWSFSANRLWLYPDKPSINDSFTPTSQFGSGKSSLGQA